MTPTSQLAELAARVERPAPFQPVEGSLLPHTATTTVDIVVPDFNEERALPGCLRTLHARLSQGFPFPWRITVADNASTDETPATAHRLADELPSVCVVHLDRKGRGLALRTVWGASDADIVAYMDVDLSTGLDGLLPLVAPLASGHSDLAIGSRLASSARAAPRVRLPLLQRRHPAHPRGPLHRRPVQRAIEGRFVDGAALRGGPASLDDIP